MASDNIFSGLKVVDFSSFVAGPSAAVILSDFGADVIKVEPPNGDPWRQGHRIPPQPLADEPYQFHLANLNKRSITCNLKCDEGKALLARLIEKADVLVENIVDPLHDVPHHVKDAEIVGLEPPDGSGAATEG